MNGFSSPVAQSVLDEPDAGQQPLADEVVQDFETFFKTHRLALIAFLRRRTAGEADAEEIAQESYARLLGYGYGGSRPSKVWRSLLYRIAANLALAQTYIALQYGSGRECEPGSDVYRRALSHANAKDRHVRNYRHPDGSVPIRRRPIG